MPVDVWLHIKALQLEAIALKGEIPFCLPQVVKDHLCNQTEDDTVSPPEHLDLVPWLVTHGASLSVAPLMTQAVLHAQAKARALQQTVTPKL